MQHTRYDVSKNVAASVLSPNTVLVESLGMQHWLNMALASSQGIAMNLQFPMPTRFMWQIARQILGSELIPEQSTYKREVLTWRIYELIQSDEIINKPNNSAIQRYFSQLTASHSNVFASPIEAANINQLHQAKKLQFCRSLADVYEQYMLYRPDWLSAWENNQSIANSELGLSAQDECWQASLWRNLVSQQSYHPASLHKLTLETLANPQRMGSVQLPKHIFVFALNTMAPQLVSFLGALASYTDIHIFHLNPCINYWGELQSQKQTLRLSVKHHRAGIATKLDQWLDNSSENTLLANLGLQGRDLFNLLQQQPSFEVSAFDAPIPIDLVPDISTASSLLLQVKQAIFEGRSQPTQHFQSCANDESIVIVKAHSPMRELQGLHDYLLACLNADKGLEPRDILIMCPAIEDYAAFIPAVFNTFGYQRGDNNIPCSVADRSPLDSMPEVSAFLTLLDITQSRFEVSAVIDYLRLPAIQKRFGIAEQELDTIVRWMSTARIHWGLNASHKQRFVNTQQSSDINTWEWGLNRLLVGFAQADHKVLQGELLTLPDAEGQQTQLLGRLCALLEQLQAHLQALKQSRNAQQWQTYLLGLRQRLFSQDDTNERAIGVIDRGITELVNHCSMAGYKDEISIFVLRDALSHSFTAPDAINQFMTGQVTFCSMLPMRSIPFKVIAMLGLNDGEFPRVTSPFSIDLIQSSPRRLGDRSRRGDDRYLFLESIISARQKLYLSYQSNSVKDNSERQPSLVLREFCDYLKQSFADDSQPDTTPYRAYELPLHAFHSSHFETDQFTVIPSYDQGWLRLAASIAKAPSESQQKLNFQVDDTLNTGLSSQELSKALADPLKYFAHQQLGLYLQHSEPDLIDSEPFSIDGLSRYNILSDLLESNGDKISVDNTANFDDSVAFFMADGGIPSDVVSKSIYNSWQPAVHELRQAFDAYQIDTQILSARCDEMRIEAKLRIAMQDDDAMLIDYRAAALKTPHRLTIRIEQMLAAVALSRPVAAKVFCLEQSKGELACLAYDFQAVKPDIALHQLNTLCKAYQLIQTGPQLLHCELGELMAKHFGHDSDVVIDSNLILTWESAFKPAYQAKSGGVSPLNNDYFEWFFPTKPSPELEDIVRLLNCYQAIFSGIKRIPVGKQKTVITA